MPRWLWLLTAVALIVLVGSVAMNARQSWLYAWISGACYKSPPSKYCDAPRGANVPGTFIRP